MWLAARHLQIFHILLLYDGLVLPRRHACPHDAASSGRTLIVRTRRPHDATQPILLRCGTPQHTLYPAKGPVLPRGPGRSPGRKFWPLQRHFNAKNHVPMTYSTSCCSKALAEICAILDTHGVVRWGKRMAQGARGRAGRVRARARRGACGARGRGAPWARGLDGHKPVQPARRSTAPGSSPAHSSSAASQLPSERRPRALPPTGAKSSLAM